MATANLQQVKQKFGIVGNSEELCRAIDIAIQVAPTDLSVLITGESGVGKESFPKIIHQHSLRKHGAYIAVNCGAIPEGTIDSELFGHEKGAFTGAIGERRGYFGEANGGTIFLDEVGELPMATQARLLRVLESGEYIKVGSSRVERTNVRIVAATNVNLPQAIADGRFREDLYYRLNTVPIKIPPLRERKEDIVPLFCKFAYDFAENYHMPIVNLSSDAEQLLTDYAWPGNIRELKNLAERISIIEQNRNITAQVMLRYIPQQTINTLPLATNPSQSDTYLKERGMILHMLAVLTLDVENLKARLDAMCPQLLEAKPTEAATIPEPVETEPVEHVDEALSAQSVEADRISKAMIKHKGNRKKVATELGITERTLLKKLKKYDLE